VDYSSAKESYRGEEPGVGRGHHYRRFEEMLRVARRMSRKGGCLRKVELMELTAIELVIAYSRYHVDVANPATEGTAEADGAEGDGTEAGRSRRRRDEEGKD